MDLKCPKCSHKWQAEIDPSQRLIFCPGCSTLVPLNEANAAPLARKGEAQMTGVLPFSLQDLEKASEAPVGSVTHRESTGSRAVLHMELAEVANLQKNLPEAQFKQVVNAAKRVFRFGIQQYGGLEVDKSKGLIVLFSRPIDAARFALNLVSMLDKTSREIGVELKSRIAIDVGEVTVIEASAGEVAAGKKPFTVSGKPLDSIRVLTAAGHPGQILMSRPAWELAQRDAGDRVPPNTRWLNHGVSLKKDDQAILEICEVGLIGLSPLAKPGVPIQSVKDPESMTMLGGFQLGADALSKSLKGLGGSSRSETLRVEDIPSFAPEHLEGRRVGNYRIDKLRVEEKKSYYYLARDTHLDRDVQLKILKKSLVNNHEELIRFLREGIAATYIGHPNIFNAHETGSEGELYYIVYEVFDGTSLKELVGNLGPMEPRTAAGHILQATRGLAAAHQAGIVHRDINPDNLLLTTEGRIEVCGLSLTKIRKNEEKITKKSGDDEMIVKQAMANVTEANVSLGTPAYIAPEQARDAASVDFPADQYSLGCVFHFLLTGQPPFTGTTTMEVMAKRAGGNITPPHKINPAIPEELSGIVVKLLAEKPQGRYPDLGALIAALEGALGVHHARAEGDEVDLSGIPDGFPADIFQDLRQDQLKYYGVSLVKARMVATWAFLLVCLSGVAASLYSGWFQFAGAAAGLYILTLVAGAVIGGVVHRTALFLRLRRGLYILPKLGWVVGILVMAGFLYFLHATGLLALWGGMAVLATVLALFFQLGIRLPLRLMRSRPVANTLDILKNLRSTGYSEADLQQVVWAAGERHWEEFFEDIFGYDDMVALRRVLQREKKAGRRAKFARWRDPIFEWIDGMEAARKTSLNQTQLAKAELKRLRKEGVGEEDARKKAREEARRMLDEERNQFKQPSNDMAAFAGGTGGVPLGRPVGSRDLRGNKYGAGQGGLLHGAMTGVRNIAGAGILLAYVGPMAAARTGIGIPPAILEFLENEYYTWGWGGSFHALIISSLIMKNAYSRRYITSMLGIIGAIMLVATSPIVTYVQSPNFDAQTCVFFGIILMVLSLGTGFLRRFTSPRGFLPF
ncbi:MAG: protein kinase [Candidatus Sumerlaeia bacterium]|nr:protein kinase [Candidatus Sumerlaeia bacterium]